jgi:hypothetical protein
MSVTQMVPQFTPAGRKFIGFLGAYNMGNREAMHQFIADSFHSTLLERQTVDMRTAWLLSYFQQTGRLGVKEFEHKDELDITVKTEAKQTGQTIHITIRVHAEAPHEVIELSIGS